MRKAELQKLMAEMGFWKINQSFGERDKAPRPHQLRKGRKYEVKSEEWEKACVFRAEHPGGIRRTSRANRTPGAVRRTEKNGAFGSGQNAQKEQSVRSGQERTERNRAPGTVRTHRKNRTPERADTWPNGGLYSGRRNTYGQRSENYQRNENGSAGNYQRNENIVTKRPAR